MLSMERKKKTEALAEKFTRLDEFSKAFIAGYITGKQEGSQHQAEEHETPVA